MFGCPYRAGLGWHVGCSPLGGPHPFVLLLFSLGVTVAAVLASSTAAGVFCALRDAHAAWRRAEARASDLALLGAAVQRWRLTPAAWGGAPSDSFEQVSIPALGLSSLLHRPDRRRTPNGEYRLIHVASCPILNRALRFAGLDEGTDGVLVVGWDRTTGQDGAVLVLSPLFQVPLARVPWRWIGDLVQKASGALDMEESPEAEGGDEPPRTRRAADREPMHPVLRLVHWPTPEAPAADARPDGGRAPPPLRRAA